jgi:type II secretory pathway component PulK
VLALVLVIGLLMSTVVIAFPRRATVDTHIAKNRDNAARAEALARGGVQIATFLIANGGSGDSEGPAPDGNTHLSDWARARDYQIETEDGGRLRLEILDAGARLNLNAVLESRDATDAVGDETVEFLVELLAKVTDELPVPPGARAWDPRELAHNLIDYVDENEERVRGGSEDDWYQSQLPPYLPANEPLRSVDELRRVEGFEPALVDGLRPYITVHPRAGGSGVNPNTAPPHVLATLYHGSQGSRQLASEDTVRRILRVREEGRILCQESGADDRCILASEIIEGSVFPPAAFGSSSKVFTVVAEATVGDISRSLEAVIDLGAAPPAILSWRPL